MHAAFSTSTGVDCNTKAVTMDDKRIKLHLWDTSGKERYLSVTTAYYPGADMVMFVYDITNSRSYKNLTHWMEQAKMNASTRNRTTMIVGNKTDLEHLRVVSTERGKQFAQGVQAMFAEVSAKSGENVKMAIMSLVREAMSKTQCRGHKKEDDTIQPNHKTCAQSVSFGNIN